MQVAWVVRVRLQHHIRKRQRGVTVKQALKVTAAAAAQLLLLLLVVVLLLQNAGCTSLADASTRKKKPHPSFAMPPSSRWWFLWLASSLYSIILFAYSMRVLHHQIAGYRCLGQRAAFFGTVWSTPKIEVGCAYMA